MALTVAYLDASAAAKLLLPDPESAALRAALSGAAIARASSSVLSVELHCLAQRANAADAARVRALLATIDLLPPTEAILARAAEPFSPPQRALDALHLATALSLEIDGLALVSYDSAQLDAAAASGLAVLSPSR